jgi:hypothetical protein
LFEEEDMEEGGEEEDQCYLVSQIKSWLLFEEEDMEEGGEEDKWMGKRFLLISSVFLLAPEDSRLLPDHEVLHGVSIRKTKKKKISVNSNFFLIL